MISIIGAGPAGCYAARILAEKGYQVKIFEEHREIGQPIQCTGIVTQQLQKLVPETNRFVINKIEKVRIHAPNGKFISLRLKNPDLILDRKKFDSYLADKAAKAGVKIHNGHEFLDKDQKKITIKNKDKIKRIKTDLLIGADGPTSKVAKTSKLWQKRKFWIGSQARVKLKNDNAVEFYPFIGTYAWIVPENEKIVRIGVVAKKNSKILLDNLMKIKGITKKDVIEFQGGLIPEYKKIRLQKNDTYILGDAALQVKATTGGGIVPGLVAAKILADCIINKRDYQSKIKGLAKELRLHQLMRKILDRFSKKDHNYLIRLFKRPKLRRLIENYDRDHPSKFVIKLLIKEPRLLLFIHKLL